MKTMNIKMTANSQLSTIESQKSKNKNKLCKQLEHRRQPQGPWAESGPPPCFIQPSTLFLPGGSAELLAPS